MEKIGPDFLDYWQSRYDPRRGPRRRFGIRMREGRIWVLMKLGNEPADTYGAGYPIPVQIESLPSYVRMIVDDHLLNEPGSDLMDVLTGKKSF